jgi:sporulation protein YlmC with PRC-barrel domain
MEIVYGAKVIGKRGKILGTISYIIRNSWTGKISKFVVRCRMSDKDLFLSPEDVLEVSDLKVKLNISIEELAKKYE